MAHHGRRNPGKKNRRRMRIRRDRAAELQRVAGLQKGDKDEDIVVKTERETGGEKRLERDVGGWGNSGGGLGEEVKVEEARTEGGLWSYAMEGVLKVKAEAGEEEEQKEAVKPEAREDENEGDKGNKDILRKLHEGGANVTKSILNRQYFFC